MCVIATHGPKAHIDKEEWDRAWRANPDGGGFATLNHDASGLPRLTLHHDLDRDALRAAYDLTRGSAATIVHMRIATHGSRCLVNTHPFPIGRDDKHHSQITQVFAHNGILRQLTTSLKDDESDSRALERLVLRHLPADWPENPGIVELVEEYLNGDRLAVLSLHTAEPIHRFGAWERTKDGIHWSNRHHARLKAAPPAWNDDADTYRAWWTTKPKTKDHTRALFPDGVTSWEDPTVWEAIEQAEDTGYCLNCLWRPCQCGKVCAGCTARPARCVCSPQLWASVEDTTTPTDNDDEQEEPTD